MTNLEHEQWKVEQSLNDAEIAVDSLLDDFRRPYVGVNVWTDERACGCDWNTLKSAVESHIEATKGWVDKALQKVCEFRDYGESLPWGSEERRLAPKLYGPLSKRYSAIGSRCYTACAIAEKFIRMHEQNAELQQTD